MKKRNNLLRFNLKYFLTAVLLFALEVLIAITVHDQFVRPFVGDFLVVMLVYCFIKGFVNLSVWKAAFFTLIFAYLVEFSQYLQILKWLGWQHITVLRIVLGSAFDWWDILSYTLGVLVILIIEVTRGAHR